MGRVMNRVLQLTSISLVTGDILIIFRNVGPDGGDRKEGPFLERSGPRRNSLLLLLLLGSQDYLKGPYPF